MHMPICFGRVKKVPKKGKAPKAAMTTTQQKSRRRRAKRRSISPKTSPASSPPPPPPESKNSKSKQITVNYDCDVDEYDLLVMGAEGRKEVANRDCIAAISDSEAPLDDDDDDDEGQDDANDDIIISSEEDEADENDQPPIMELVSDDCSICNGRIRSGADFALRCIQLRCKLICHIECLADRCLEPGQYVPVEGDCPICDGHFLWGDLIRKANGCSDLVEDANSTGLFEVDDVSDCDGDGM